MSVAERLPPPAAERPALRLLERPQRAVRVAPAPRPFATAWRQRLVRWAGLLLR